jgi:hypothetical protein
MVNMKTALKNLTILMTVPICLIACDNQSKSNDEESNTEVSQLQQTMINDTTEPYIEAVTCALQNQNCPALFPLDTAIAKIKAYAEAWNNVPLPSPNDSGLLDGGSLPIYPTVAFGISVTDMIAAYGIRVENGQLTYSYEHIRAYVGLDGNPIAQHLYFTPVDENGEDKLMKCGDNQYVMEITVPCPNTCGVNSPLFQAFNQTLNVDRRADASPILEPLGPLTSSCEVNP